MHKSTDIRTLKNLSKPVRYSIPDTKGLHLWVQKNQKKYWIFRYTIHSKRYDMSLGSFPEISLAEAKIKAQKLRGKILNGVNPAVEKKASRDEKLSLAPKVTFREFALPYIETMSPQWKNAKHAEQWVSTISTYAFPVIGKLSLEAITTRHIQEILTPIWNAKRETAGRVRGRIEKIISAAITSGLRTSANPAIWKGHLENILPLSRRQHVHHAALPYKELPELMIKLEEIDGLAALALKFTILNASRTGEVLHSMKSEVLNGVLTIPAKRMKAKREHQVPLCSKSLEIINAARNCDPDSPYIFSKKGKPLSGMAMLMMIRRLKIGITVHGFRSTFRDWVSEETNHSPEVAEMALAHTIGNKVEAAYRRGKLLERRRLLMQDWQDFCFSANPSATHGTHP